MSMGQQWSPLANKVAPVASKALGVAAPISGALSAANSDAFNGSTGSKILGGTLGAAQGAATAAAFMPAVVGSGPLAPIVATVGIPASMFVDAGLNRYRDNVALQSADQGA
ncbi:MAG: hypothetical protein EBU46_12225, partial [Nitrosomonadaceae bacterium]|nr:hypothetical protein [Nitrosomonadaceae bacterium]